MQIISFISVILVIRFSTSDQAEGNYETSEEFEEQLNYFGSVEILQSILQDYASVEDQWITPEYEQFDRQVINSLENLVNEVYDNESYHDAVKPSSAMRVLTNFCGPGNWSIDGEVTQNPYFQDIDLCCKKHDECPDYIVKRKDYERFPGLPYKPQIFTRWTKYPTTLSCFEHTCEKTFLNMGSCTNYFTLQGGGQA